MKDDIVMATTILAMIINIVIFSLFMGGSFIDDIIAKGESETIPYEEFGYDYMMNESSAVETADSNFGGYDDDTFYLVETSASENAMTSAGSAVSSMDISNYADYAMWDNTVVYGTDVIDRMCENEPLPTYMYHAS